MKFVRLALKMSPLLLLSACVHTPSWDDNHRSTLSSLVEQEQYAYKRQSTLIKSNGSLDEVVSLSDSALSSASSMQRECENVRPNHRMWMDCMDLSKISIKIAAEMKISAAKYAASQGNKAVAKSQYRDVVTTFTGQSYTSYVKQAEFGLEDLK